MKLSIHSKLLDKDFKKPIFFTHLTRSYIEPISLVLYFSEFARYFRGSGGIFLGERWNIFEGVVEYSWGRGEIFFGGWWNILIGSSIANVGRKG